ncbi:MAG: N-acetyl-gamma-glutamyl-phosphate reductase [Leptonema sp. (in: bacteria)]
MEVAILGAGGYTGKEILKILNSHNFIKPIHITSNQFENKKIKEIFPELELSKIENLKFLNHNAPIPPKIPVLLATPNLESMHLVKQLQEEERIVIDLSGAYRIDDLETFSHYYNIQHQYPELLKQKVYGLTEIYRDKIKNAQLISNPGCYPTSILLPLYFFRAYLKEATSIVINSYSGISGAGGRVESEGFLFSNIYENTKGYKILKHQHEPEMKQYLKDFSDFNGILVFTPHLLPAFRGILSTIIILWNSPVNIEFERIKDQIEQEPFVRIYANPEDVELKKVQFTNYCDFSFRTRDKTTVIVSAIDNLMKGAAGQAIQNLNLRLGLPETEGLK